MAISEDPPALPPRPNTGTSEQMDFSPLGKTPPAWLYALIRHSPGDDNHQHDFYLSTEFDTEFETVFLCQKCHNWFHLTTTAPGNIDYMNLEQNTCHCNLENNLHHLHTTIFSRTDISAKCCMCSFTVNIEIREPSIDMRMFDELSKLRRHSYANAVKHDTRRSALEYKTDLVDVVDNMIKIVDNVLKNDLQALKINCENYKEKIGIDEVSQTFFKRIGFKLMNDCLILPDYLSEDEKMKIKLTKDELIMISLDLRLHLKSNAKKPYEKLNIILGTKYKHRYNGSYTNFDPSSGTRSLQSSCFFLGCVSDMDDETLIWAYRIGIKDDQEKVPEYLQAVYEMSKERKSEALGELVAIERSQGKFNEEDIKEAYSSLTGGVGADVHSSALSDDLLIDSYLSLIKDRPNSSARYRDALCIIGRSRNSHQILDLLNEEPVNDMFEIFSEMPVGLDNIGNTCYLNSLLQYYFTIRSLRNAVLYTDSSSANDYEIDWQSITIGHRKVSKSEVERAKKFVALLRDLFVNLIHTSQKSLSPDVDLAYLALVDAKNDDDEYKEASKSPSISHENKMVIDDSSPGPSSSKADHMSDYNDHSFIESEELTVEMEGTAPSADIKDEDNLYHQNNEPNASHSLKGKEKENIFPAAQTFGPELPPDISNTTKEDKLRAASEMLFGKQHDVTECMDNVMFQLEAALKLPLNEYDEENIIKRLFYGQTRQILHKEQDTGEPLTKEEFFNHLIVVVAEGRDLYDGLDVYFDASMVEYDGTQATREVTITRVPPILQIHVQRVQFDRSTSNIYKSNAFLRFDKVIYLDRYLDKNYELLKQRRDEAHRWKQEIDRLQAELKDFERDKSTTLPAAELLKLTADFVHAMKNDIIDENFDWQLSVVEQESNRANEEIEAYRSKIKQLKSQLKDHYKDLREHEYRLHAVFIHSGQATFGHYWIYIYDFEKDRWLKFNDSYVTEVKEHVVFDDTTGSSANPYCMVYVRAQDAKELVETVCRKSS